jgi:hypothetical protein
LGALGVVFGDIGTSPIYTMQTVFNPGDPHPVTATRDSIFGIVSLIFWSVAIVVTVTFEPQQAHRAAGDARHRRAPPRAARACGHPHHRDGAGPARAPARSARRRRSRLHRRRDHARERPLRYMDGPDVPAVLALLEQAEIECPLDVDEASYFRSTIDLHYGDAPGMSRWRKRLFLARRTSPPTPRSTSGCHATARSSWAHGSSSRRSVRTSAVRAMAPRQIHVTRLKTRCRPAPTAIIRPTANR